MIEKSEIDKNIEISICKIWNLCLLVVSLHYVFHSIRFLRLTKIGARRCSFFYIPMSVAGKYRQQVCGLLLSFQAQIK